MSKQDGDDDKKGVISIRLSGLEHSIHSNRSVSSRRAAVLVGLFETTPSLPSATTNGCKQQNNELQVLLTQRSSRLNSHAGEVCLPGGKCDDNETSALQTALREAKEEIGLPGSSVLNVFGELLPRLSKHLLSVTPIVAQVAPPIWHNKKAKDVQLCQRQEIDYGDNVDGFIVRPNEDEVEHVFCVPLRLFYDPPERCYSYYDYHDFHGHVLRIHQFDYKCDDNTNRQDYTIWGLTAHILVELAQMVYGTQTSTSEDEDPSDAAAPAQTTQIELDPPNGPRHTDLHVVTVSGKEQVVVSSGEP